MVRCYLNFRIGMSVDEIAELWIGVAGDRVRCRRSVKTNQ